MWRWSSVAPAMSITPSFLFHSALRLLRTRSKSQLGISASRFLRACSRLMNEVPILASITSPGMGSNWAQAPRASFVPMP